MAYMKGTLDSLEALFYKNRYSLFLIRFLSMVFEQRIGPLKS